MGTNILVSTENLSNKEWLRWRQKGIGGSDVAPILGISKWSSAVDIWLSKTNQKHDDCVQNEAMIWGHILEPVIRNHFREITGKKVIEVHAILQSEEHPFMIADIDGLTTDDNGNLPFWSVSVFRNTKGQSGIMILFHIIMWFRQCII